MKMLTASSLQDFVPARVHSLGVQLKAPWLVHFLFHDLVEHWGRSVAELRSPRGASKHQCCCSSSSSRLRATRLQWKVPIYLYSLRQADRGCAISTPPASFLSFPLLHIDLRARQSILLTFGFAYTGPTPDLSDICPSFPISRRRQKQDMAGSCWHSHWFSW